MWHNKISGLVAVEDTESGKILWRHPPDATEMVRQKDKRYKYAQAPKSATPPDSRAPTPPEADDNDGDDGEATVNDYDFSRFNKADLRSFAQQAGIKEDTSRWNKGELIEALGQTDFIPAPTPGADDDGEEEDENDD